MKYFLFIVLFSCSMATYAQSDQIGLRIGEPLSITYKTYIKKDISAEAMIGRGGPNSIQYYRRAFENNRPLSSAIYNSQSASNALSLNLRLAYHQNYNSEFNISEGLLLGYGGVGLQMRSVEVTYYYHTPTGSETLPVSTETRNNIDFGPEAFIGTEYLFQDLPISAFAEFGFFLELMDRLGHLKIQGGIGVRYLF
ncbi:MAG: hypothetical protein WD431_00360 [Cyclobacteriaceae bacterium]